MQSRKHQHFICNRVANIKSKAIFSN